MKPTWHVFVWRAKVRSAILAKQEMSQPLTDTLSYSKRQGIVYHSSCDIFWALHKQVHHRDLHGKSLMSVTNPLSLAIHIKTLWIAQEDSGGYIT